MTPAATLLSRCASSQGISSSFPIAGALVEAMLSFHSGAEFNEACLIKAVRIVVRAERAQIL